MGQEKARGGGPRTRHFFLEMKSTVPVPVPVVYSLLKNGDKTN